MDFSDLDDDELSFARALEYAERTRARMAAPKSNLDRFMEQQRAAQFDPGSVEREPEPPKTTWGATKQRRFNGHWERTPKGLRFVEDKVWYE